MRMLGVRTLRFSVVLSSLFGSHALAQHFYELAGKKGCESVMASLRTACDDLNDKKNRACASQGNCDLQKQIDQIAQYKADIQRLDSGVIAVADRDSFKESIEKMKAGLDARKNDAPPIQRAARECQDAREAVHDFFAKEVIPETNQAASEAKDRRKALLEQLGKAEVLQRAAKDKRDSLADSDPEKAKIQEEYEKSAAAYREIEGQLAEFNRTHGNDIDAGLQRLIDYYNSEQKQHETEIENQKDRSEKCAKLEYLSY